jgi:hypothetical protein
VILPKLERLSKEAQIRRLEEEKIQRLRVRQYEIRLLYERFLLDQRTAGLDIASFPNSETVLKMQSVAPLLDEETPVTQILLDPSLEQIKVANRPLQRKSEITKLYTQFLVEQRALGSDVSTHLTIEDIFAVPSVATLIESDGPVTSTLFNAAVESVKADLQHHTGVIRRTLAAFLTSGGAVSSVVASAIRFVPRNHSASASEEGMHNIISAAEDATNAAILHRATSVIACSVCDRILTYPSMLSHRHDGQITRANFRPGTQVLPLSDAPLSYNASPDIVATIKQLLLSVGLPDSTPREVLAGFGNKFICYCCKRHNARRLWNEIVSLSYVTGLNLELWQVEHFFVEQKSSANPKAADRHRPHPNDTRQMIRIGVSTINTDCEMSAD